jgi:gliding motility-associated-like protein
MRFFSVHFSITLFLVLFHVKLSQAQLKANAGVDQTICPGTTVTIGSSAGATGGKAPYTYNWFPATGLNSTTLPNPTASPNVTTTYRLIVTDDTLAVDTAYVTITTNIIGDVNAGRDTSICENVSIILGGPKNSDNGGIVYSWTPAQGLSDPSSPHPAIKPTSTVTYWLTATIAGCPPKKDTITVTVIPTPVVDAGSDVVIKEGETVTLHGTGGIFYIWEPRDSIKYFDTANPDVQPGDTMKYYVFGSDPTKTCYGIDSVMVFVEKSSDVIIYNTFTPNGDGSNDTWYIANIWKHPNCKLEVYNRDGRLVYKVKNYLNTWTGKASGEELPAAAYYYVLDLGDNKHIYHGTVSIVR